MITRYDRDGREGLNTKKGARFLALRNWLNLIFMVGAIVGLILYFTVGHTIGIIVILASMVFKIVECCLRFIH